MWARRYPWECGAFLLAGLPALYLAVRGNTMDHRWALWSHIMLALIALTIVGLRFFRADNPRNWKLALVTAAVLLEVVPVGAALYYKARPNHRIQNPSVVPVSMDQEGAGAHSPFAPSSAQTNTGAIIPSNFFMDSEACGNCHKDIYQIGRASCRERV